MLKLRLYDGSYHDVDSSETAFKVAASLGITKLLLKKPNQSILEPIMKVTITAPEDYLGDIMGHITARRGRVEGMEARGNAQIVRAMVPLLRNVWLRNNSTFFYSRTWNIHNGI